MSGKAVRETLAALGVIAFVACGGSTEPEFQWTPLVVSGTVYAGGHPTPGVTVEVEYRRFVGYQDYGAVYETKTLDTTESGSDGTYNLDTRIDSSLCPGTNQTLRIVALDPPFSGSNEIGCGQQPSNVDIEMICPITNVQCLPTQSPADLAP